MAKGKRPDPDESPDDLEAPPLYYGLTPNQVVAHNLQQIRQWRRLTQSEAAEAIEPYVGKRWSKANFSAAERSIAGERIRQFDADEIVAFAKAFDVPVTWFFLPPAPWAQNGVPVHLQHSSSTEPLAVLADLIFGDNEGRSLLELRLQYFLQELGPGPLSDTQQRITQLVDAKKTALVEHAVADLTHWQTALRSLANQLEDLQQRARTAARTDLAATDSTNDTAPTGTEDAAAPAGTATKAARTRKGASKR